MSGRAGSEARWNARSKTVHCVTSHPRAISAGCDVAILFAIPLTRRGSFAVMQSPQDEHIPVAADAFAMHFTNRRGCTDLAQHMATAATLFASSGNIISTRDMRCA